VQILFKDDLAVLQYQESEHIALPEIVVERVGLVVRLVVESEGVRGLFERERARGVLDPIQALVGDFVHVMEVEIALGCDQ
jgi:hypothetical protein